MGNGIDHERPDPRPVRLGCPRADSLPSAQSQLQQFPWRFPGGLPHHVIREREGISPCLPRRIVSTLAVQTFCRSRRGKFAASEPEHSDVSGIPKLPCHHPNTSQHSEGRFTEQVQ